MSSKTIQQLESEIDRLANLSNTEFYKEYRRLNQEILNRQGRNAVDLYSNKARQIAQNVAEQNHIDSVERQLAVDSLPDKLAQAGYVHRPNYYIEGAPSESSVAESSVWDTETSFEFSDLAELSTAELTELELLAEVAPEAFVFAILAYGTYKAGEAIYNQYKKPKPGSIPPKAPSTPPNDPIWVGPGHGPVIVPPGPVYTDPRDRNRFRPR
jgi:hypothetical protein